MPLIPSYADINTFKKVASGEKSAPSVAPGVAIAAGMAAVQSLLHLVGKDNNRPEPIVAPHVLSIDAYTGQSKVIKHPIISHYRTLATMITRNILKKNPKTSY